MLDHFKNNFKIKLFSIIFAFIMWVYVMSEVDPIVIRSFENISVETVTNIDEIRDNGLTFAYGQDFNVKVDFRAKRSVLNEYIRNGVTPKGEIYDPKEGTNMMQVVMDAPREIEYSLNPLQIEVVLERSVVSMKNIVINTEGSLRTDYVIGQIKPNRVGLYVEGPQSQVEKVMNLSGTVKLENNDSDFSTKINLVPLDDRNNIVEGVTIRESSVIVDVDVDKTKNVPVELVFVDDQGQKVPNSSFRADVENVRIQGSADAVDAVKSLKTVPVKISGFNRVAGVSYELEKTAELVYSIERIKIKEIQSELEEYTLMMPRAGITLTGEADAEAIKSAIPPETEIKITAGREYSDRINPDNIRILIDNKAAQEKYKLQYEVDFPIFSIKITPEVITITEN